MADANLHKINNNLSDQVNMQSNLLYCLSDLFSPLLLSDPGLWILDLGAAKGANAHSWAT